MSGKDFSRTLDTRKAAQQIWQEWGVFPPVPIKEIVKDLGIEYEECDLNEEISGLYVQANQKIHIIVNSIYPPEDRLIAASHELFHWLSHHGDKEPHLFFDLKFQKRECVEEQLAERFAVELVLPEHLVMSGVMAFRHADWEQKIRAMCQWWVVSPDVLKRRLWELGLYCP
jgi:Zn-dependent peptidase ImmA (M78 family)